MCGKHGRKHLPTAVSTDCNGKPFSGASAINGPKGKTQNGQKSEVLTAGVGHLNTLENNIFI